MTSSSSAWNCAPTATWSTCTSRTSAAAAPSRSTCSAGTSYQDGLAYYESTRDTASHFFIDYLPKGTYVFEYSTRVQLKGRYQSGLAEIQCMYAPEFNSHSQSFMLDVK